MTYVDTTQRDDYTATSGQTVFAYTFRILTEAALKVYDDGTLKILPTDYIVSGVGNAGGGNVTFGTGITLDNKVILIRETPDTQSTDLTASDSLPAETLETSLDKVTMKNQDLDEKLGRALKFPITSALSDIDAPEGTSATDRGTKVWAWNTAGTGLELIAVTNIDSTSLIAVKGDIIQGGTAGAAEKLGIGTTGQSSEVVAGKLAYITQKTLSDFTNAQHDHSDNAGGGSLAAASTASVNYRSGLNCKQATTVTITVEGGVIDVNGTVITKTSDTTLTITTANNWIGGSSLQATGTYGYIYVDVSGNILMHTTAPDEADTSGNTSGILRYNDHGGATDYRMFGWFYMNATGSGELSSYEVGNLKDGDAHNSVVRTDSTQNAVNDTSYAADLTNTQVHFYTSGRGTVQIKCVINGDVSGTLELVTILNDGSDINASQQGNKLAGSSNTDAIGVIPTHMESYVQGGVTFEARAKVDTGTFTVEEKTMIIVEV